MTPIQRQRWQQLRKLLDRADRGLDQLSVAEVKELCRSYRQVTIDLSRARTDADDPELVRFLNHLAGRAHGHVYRARPLRLQPVVEFGRTGFPRLVRRHVRPILVAAAVLFVTALASWLAVVRQPELAYSLFNEDLVEFKNVRLERQEGEYKGNFTFDARESPLVALGIIGNNIKVAITVFALGALGCLPGVLLLVYNGRMLGTLTGLVWNHGYLVAFYSLILTHGILELSAICIAGGAGLLLGWSLIAPGPRSRSEAMRQTAGDALGLLAGAAGLVVIAGILEAHVTPHFAAPVRWSVAGLSAIGLAGYLCLAGRPRRSTAAPVP